jgi:hypothetical protein
MPVVAFLPTRKDYFLVPAQQVQHGFTGTVTSGVILFALDNIAGQE